MHPKIKIHIICQLNCALILFEAILYVDVILTNIYPYCFSAVLSSLSLLSLHICFFITLFTLSNDALLLLHNIILLIFYNLFFYFFFTFLFILLIVFILISFYQCFAKVSIVVVFFLQLCIFLSYPFPRTVFYSSLMVLVLIFSSFFVSPINMFLTLSFSIATFSSNC